MNTLRQLLALEAKLKISDDLLDRLLEGGVEIRLAPHQAMIDEGEYNPDVYIVKSGIIRGTNLNQNVEVTSGFALPGTMFMSFYCYYGEEQSFYRFEACCESTVIRIPKAHFDNLVKESHEFARWVVSAHQNQLYYYERKNQLLSGSSRERLIALLKMLSAATSTFNNNVNVDKRHETKVKELVCNRWDRIFSIIPSRYIASYLGITEQHFSKIKREVLNEFDNKQ